MKCSTPTPVALDLWQHILRSQNRCCTQKCEHLSNIVSSLCIHILWQLWDVHPFVLHFLLGSETWWNWNVVFLWWQE